LPCSNHEPIRLPSGRAMTPSGRACKAPPNTTTRASWWLASGTPHNLLVY
jgi:hypothetical protein